MLSKRMTGVCCLSCRVRDAGYAHEDDYAVLELCVCV